MHLSVLNIFFSLRSTYFIVSRPAFKHIARKPFSFFFTANRNTLSAKKKKRTEVRPADVFGKLRDAYRARRGGLRGLCRVAVKLGARPLWPLSEVCRGVRPRASSALPRQPLVQPARDCATLRLSQLKSHPGELKLCDELVSMLGQCVHLAQFEIL